MTSINFDIPEETACDSRDMDDSKDLSNYTIVDADHLDEDQPIRGQEYCLFSFLSPEGVMNCNVRSVKFRGAFPSMERAEEYAKTLESKDKYFKIFIGESGKWLDFDPPTNRVEREMTSNKDHQQILDAQAKQRMEKINTLAGKYKASIDKKDAGKKDRINELKKAGAATDANNKHKQNPRISAKDNIVARLKKRLDDKKNKESTKQSSVADKNIQEIKQLMSGR